MSVRLLLAGIIHGIRNAVLLLLFVVVVCGGGDGGGDIYILSTGVTPKTWKAVLMVSAVASHSSSRDMLTLTI